MEKEILIKEIQISDFDRVTWDSFVTYPVQSYLWAESRSLLGMEIRTCAIYTDGVITDTVLFILHKVPFAGYKATVLKGAFYSQNVYDAFIKYAQVHNIKFYVFEPDVFLKQDIPIPAMLREYKHRQFAKWTALIDLTTPIETIEAAFSKTVRNESRRAINDGIVVAHGTSDADFDNFMHIMEITKKRNNFHGYTREYYNSVFQSLKKNEEVLIFSVHTSKQELVASAFVFKFKGVLYYAYAGSLGNETPKGAMYLLVKKIIEYGIEEKMHSLDLFGTLDPEYKGEHPWKGFTQFKKSFSPQFKEYVGAYVLVVSLVSFKVHEILLIVKSRLTFMLKKVR